MKQLDIQDSIDELEFVKKAVNKFNGNKIYTTHSLKNPSEGALFAVRCGLSDDCLLVFRIGDEPRIYKQVLAPAQELKFYIGVEYDERLGWIVTWPQVYDDGIEQESESKHEIFRDAQDHAARLCLNTGLPLIMYNKEGVQIERK